MHAQSAHGSRRRRPWTKPGKLNIEQLLLCILNSKNNGFKCPEFHSMGNNEQLVFQTTIHYFRDDLSGTPTEPKETKLRCAGGQRQHDHSTRHGQ